MREFQAAIRFEPANVAARLSYAAMLNDMHSFGEAEAQAEAVIHWDPNVAEAHELLGTLLERKGVLDAALAEYRESVRLNPGFDRSQLNLGAVLLDRGDKAEARDHLSIAVKSSDPNLRQIAAGLLRRVQ